MGSKERIKIILMAGSFCVFVLILFSLYLKYQPYFDRRFISTYLNPKYYSCLNKAKTIKVGITRKEFERDFYLSNPGNCYLVRACGYGLGSQGVCVEAAFRSSGKEGPVYYLQTGAIHDSGEPSKRDDDVLIKISEPFLQHYSSD